MSILNMTLLSLVLTVAHIVLHPYNHGVSLDTKRCTATKYRQMHLHIYIYICIYMYVEILTYMLKSAVHIYI